MNDFRNNPYLLIDKYLAGDMSDEEQEYFLECVRENDQFAEQVRKNVITDILLFNKYHNAISVDHCESSLPDTRSSDDLLFAEAAATPLPDVNTVYVSPESIDLGPNGIYNDRDNRSARFWTPRHVLLTIAGEAFLIVSVIIAVLYMVGKTPRTVADFKSVVAVNHAIDAVWEDGTPVYKPGEESGATVMNLKSGLVKLTFARGAEVVLEGPTEFVVNDDSSCFCPRGTLHAFVPAPAVGFEIKTPFTRLVDRGTAFSVKVERNESRVDVISGKVDLMSSPKVAPLALVSGQAGCVLRDTQPQVVTASSSQYISPDDIVHRLDDYSKKLMKLQTAKNQELSADPNLIALYNFNVRDTSRYLNMASNANPASAEAVTTGTSPGEGRYPGWSSIAIKSKSDRISLNVPGSFDEMTLQMTFRLEELPDAGTILVTSDDIMARPGAFVLQIIRGGRLQLHVRTAQQDKYTDYFSEPFLFKSNCRTWFTLKVVADRKSQSVIFYADGKEVSRTPWKEQVPFELGQATIGNVQNRLTKTERSFRGNIEEFMLMKVSRP